MMILQSDFVRHPDLFFIDGKWSSPSTSAALDMVNSATGESYGSVAEAQEADIDRAVEAARRAFDHGPWPRLSPRERAKYVRALGQEFARRKVDLAKVWTVESGVTYVSGTGALDIATGLYDMYADFADSFAFEEQYETGPGGANTGLLVRESVGVVGAILPWNGTPLLITYKCAPALLAGCTIVLKASPEAPHSALIFAEMCERIGIPPGVVNVVTADRSVSELLVRHPGIDKITFTGSTAAGKRVGAICGERVARCTLELGGKSPGIILDDYDLETAAAAISNRARYLTGQVCSSLTRIIVTRARHDTLVEALIASFGSVRLGDPFAPDTEMGPLAMKRGRERVESYVEKGKAEGARLAVGGRRPPQLEQGFYFEPTIFCNVDNRSSIGREEIFGPVLSIIPASDEDEAVSIANDTNYGLAGAVFTNDVERAYSVGRKLRAGTIGHNSHRSDFYIAAGGFKESGIGREGGIEGLLEFLETKTLLLDGLPGHLDRAV